MSKRTRKGVSGKDAAAGERDDEALHGEADAEPESTPAPDRMANWAEGETRIVHASDRAILRYGAVLVGNACKNAQRLNASLGIAKEETQTRLNQAEALKDLVDNADSRGRPDGAAAAPPLRADRRLDGVLARDGDEREAGEEGQGRRYQATR